jgi:hypothetical protein
MDRGRMIAGGSLVMVGGVLAAGQLGVADAGAVIAGWWPVAVIAAGVLRLVDRDAVGGAMVTTLGVVLLAWRQDLLGADAWQWLAPVVLIGLGVWLLLRRPRARTAGGHGAGPVLDVVALLAGREVRTEAAPFRGGSATAVLGSAELDLTASTLPPEGATLELVAVLGGVELQVPDDWHVRVEGPAILGGIEDRTVPAPAGAPLLRIEATALLGGIEISSRTARRSTPPTAPPSATTHAEKELS